MAKKSPVAGEDQIADPAPGPEPVQPQAAEPAPEIAPAPDAGRGGLAEIAAALVKSMPEPQPDAIAAVRHDASPTDDTPAPTPEPEKKRGRGRPPGSGKSKVSIPGKGEKAVVAASPQADSAAKALAATKLAAATATQMTILTGVMLGGEDFKPDKNPIAGDMRDDEILRDAYFEYFQAKGIVDIPPGVALVSAIVVYVMPRLNKPNAQTRIGFVASKTKAFFARLFRKKNGPQSNTRDDGERQNDNGDTSGGSL